MDIRFVKPIQATTTLVFALMVAGLTACSSMTTQTATDVITTLDSIRTSRQLPANEANDSAVVTPSSNPATVAVVVPLDQDTAEKNLSDAAGLENEGPFDSADDHPDAQHPAQIYSAQPSFEPSTRDIEVESTIPTTSDFAAPSPAASEQSNAPLEDVGEQPAIAQQPATETQDDNLPSVVSRAVFESRAEFSNPRDLRHADEDTDIVANSNVNDGFHFAPIKHSSEVHRVVAPVVTNETPELSSVARDILANAESPEVSLALAQSISGVKAADLMPQLWVQDDSVQLDTVALKPFSVQSLPMYQRGVEFDPIETSDSRRKTQPRIAESSNSKDWLAPKRSSNQPMAVSNQPSQGRQVSYDSIEASSSFVNIQSGNNVEVADVIGGVYPSDIASNPIVSDPFVSNPIVEDCNSCPTGEYGATPCPVSETVMVPASSIRPPDEYVCDGGDAGVHVRVNDDWSVRGLDLEDTVGHFDTLDGRTLVSPSNSVCVYAPRFANVLKVIGAFSDDQIMEPGRLLRPEIVGQDRKQESFLALDQRQMPKRDVQIGSALVFRDRTRGISMNIRQRVGVLTNVQEVYQDFHVLQFGIFKRSEKARLAEFVDAAEVWTDAVGPEVLIDNVAATIDVTSQQPAVAYHVDDSGNPQLRIIKIASTKEALPGDEVEFTLRFDNVGDQTIGNVTIIDNLTARLEYVPSTAKCDVQADFFTEENDGGSLTLRWEIIQPLKAGEGGVVTFKCKMR